MQVLSLRGTDVNKLNEIISQTMFTKNIIILLLFCTLSAFSSRAVAQDENIYDHYKDTLVMLDGMILDTYKVLLHREQVIAVDTLTVNQKGLQVASFSFSALSLGANVTLKSNNGLISDVMKAEIMNEKTLYKFIYLKDIVLKSADGQTFSPTLSNIKITFSN